MTAATADVTPPQVTVQRGPSWAARDTWVVARRDLLRALRMPDAIVFMVIQPIMFVVLFVYVFGDSIALPGYEFSYRQYLMSGIFVQTLVFGSVAATSIGIADDLHRGMVDRFRSLPMTRMSLLVGRTVADIARNVFTLLVMLAVAFAVGFRFEGGLLRGVAALLLGLLFGFSFAWIAVCLGLVVRSVEAAQSAGLVWLFPLTFASSAFVSTENMPGWLEAFANVNPVSVTVNSLRALFDGTAVGSDLWQSLAWCVGVTAVFMPLAVRLYRRTTSQ